MEVSDKQLKIILNTNDPTFSFPVEGILDSVIINTPEKVSIIIQSELGYEILHRNEIQGAHYLAPRAKITFPRENLIHEDKPTEFNLNERLEITLIGPSNIIVDLTFRLK